MIPGEFDYVAPASVDEVLGALRDGGLRVVLDGRRFWDPDAIEALGLEYIGPGRGDAVLQRPADAEAFAATPPLAR